MSGSLKILRDAGGYADTSYWSVDPSNTHLVLRSLAGCSRGRGLLAAKLVQHTLVHTHPRSTHQWKSNLRNKTIKQSVLKEIEHRPIWIEPLVYCRTRSTWEWKVIHPCFRPVGPARLISLKCFRSLMDTRHYLKQY